MSAREGDNAMPPQNEIAEITTRQQLFDRAVADALARQFDKANPLPTEDRIRFLSREEAQSVIKALMGTDEFRKIAREETRDILGAIGFDVSSFKAQAATAGEISRWRETNETIGSTLRKVISWAGGLIALAILTATAAFYGLKQK